MACGGAIIGAWHALHGAAAANEVGAGITYCGMTCDATGGQTGAQGGGHSGGQAVAASGAA